MKNFHLKILIVPFFTLLFSSSVSASFRNSYFEQIVCYFSDCSLPVKIENKEALEQKVKDPSISTIPNGAVIYKLDEINNIKKDEPDKPIVMASEIGIEKDISSTEQMLPRAQNTLSSLLGKVFPNYFYKTLIGQPYVAKVGTSERQIWGIGGEGETPYLLQEGQIYQPENFTFLSEPLTSESIYKYYNQKEPVEETSQSDESVTTKKDEISNYKPVNTDSNCEPFGVINKASNINIRPEVKYDLARICSAFGRKLVVVDAVRANQTFSNPCQPPSRHLSAEAIDFEIDNYGTRQDQAMLLVALIGLGYNIGSYQKNFPLHADRGQCPHWQTWSKIARSAPSQYIPYQQQVVDALNIIGKPARSSGEFTSLYGKFPRSEMVKAAKKAIQKTGNQKLIKFLTLPQENVSNS